MRAGLYALFMAALLVTSLRIVRPAETSSFVRSRSDFEDYYRAAVMTGRGEDPYRLDQLRKIMELPRTLKPQDFSDPARLEDILLLFSGLGTYLYLPLTAFLLQPFTLLEYEAAAAVFQILSLLCLVLLGVVLYRDRKKPEGEFSPSFLGALYLLAGFLLENGANGNIAVFLLLLTSSGIVLSFKPPRLLQFAGGLLIGTAVVLKITPVFLLLVLFAYMRAAALAGAGAGIAAGLAVPALAFGGSRTIELTRGWVELILETYSKYVFFRPWANNQTISGAVGKWFLPGSDLKQAEAGLPLTGGIVDEAFAAFLADCVRITNGVLWLLALVCACAVLFFLFRGRFGEFIKSVLSGKEHSAGLTVYSAQVSHLVFIATLVSLVTAGVSWYHAYSVLLLPVYLRLCAARDGEKLQPGEKICGGLIALFSFVPSLLSSHDRTVLALYSVFTVAVVIMIVYSASVILRSGKANGI